MKPRASNLAKTRFAVEAGKSSCSIKQSMMTSSPVAIGKVWLQSKDGCGFPPRGIPGG